MHKLSMGVCCRIKLSELSDCYRIQQTTSYRLSDCYRIQKTTSYRFFSTVPYMLRSPIFCRKHHHREIYVPHLNICEYNHYTHYTYAHTTVYEPPIYYWHAHPYIIGTHMTMMMKTVMRYKSHFYPPIE